ncbi:ejaculatory bulb-specific protein 3-like isoform X2 [Belonocnema kinseyi]|uniref:ejaculatory bulb-specific protein 3-like isoform X2 n=1 Tax=Belonocnema kinseyi TaxID=2817044 RepID=UPI00143DC89D|nr:ejaculatory bulb-specific protein 3-like isoform X2 [Belonocnema kinseyi]
MRDDKYIFATQDVTKMLQNRTLVQRQINCALDRVPCDALGNQIKGLIMETIANSCRRCSQKHVKMSKQVIEFMQDNYPKEFREIIQHTINKLNQQG